MTKVELFEAIRRDKLVRGKSIRKIAQDRGAHRRTVRQALKGAIPPARRRAKLEPPVLTVAMRKQVDTWLEADRRAPRKQRHTARRICQRLRAEKNFTGVESTVRRFVGRRRRELGVGKEAFVPLAHAPGEEAEVDWYEAVLEFPRGRERVQVYEMRGPRREVLGAQQPP